MNDYLKPEKLNIYVEILRNSQLLSADCALTLNCSNPNLAHRAGAARLQRSRHCGPETRSALRTLLCEQGIPLTLETVT